MSPKRKTSFIKSLLDKILPNRSTSSEDEGQSVNKNTNFDWEKTEMPDLTYDAKFGQFTMFLDLVICCRGICSFNPLQQCFSTFFVSRHT